MGPNSHLCMDAFIYVRHAGDYEKLYMNEHFKKTGDHIEVSDEYKAILEAIEGFGTTIYDACADFSSTLGKQDKLETEFGTIHPDQHPALKGLWFALEAMSRPNIKDYDLLTKCYRGYLEMSGPPDDSIGASSV